VQKQLQDGAQLVVGFILIIIIIKKFLLGYIRCYSDYF
jgi:hypothetical protein